VVVDVLVGMGSRAVHRPEARIPVKTIKRGAYNDDCTPPVAEAHRGRRASKRTTAVKTSIPKEEEVGEQQHEGSELEFQ
jgi:hypothetical protein